MLIQLPKGDSTKNFKRSGSKLIAAIEYTPKTNENTSKYTAVVVGEIEESGTY